MKISIFKKKYFFLKIGIFFSKLGKKSPKFHWELGQILAPENTKKIPYMFYTFSSLVYYLLPKDNLFLRTYLYILYMCRFAFLFNCAMWLQTYFNNTFRNGFTIYVQKMKFLKRQSQQKSFGFVIHRNILETSWSDSAYPYQTAPVGVVWSESTLFASLFTLQQITWADDIIRCTFCRNFKG